MPVEIERKYLVNKHLFDKVEKATPIYIKQGYLTSDKALTIRVRVAGFKAYITIKGKTIGFTRAEYEYAIPVAEASEMLETLATAVLEKTRYEIDYKGFKWEVDVFLGTNSGLLMAEIELLTEKTTFELPDWIGAEVTGDERYYNSYLAANPYQYWK